MNINIQDPGKLITDGGSLSEAAGQFGAEVKKIYGVIDDLKNSWVGESSSRFTSNVESFRADFEKFAEVIGQFGELVSAVGTDYQKLESEL